ncbi:hypothetical protein HYQ46_011225 [Verticillium longisporum]|nr:hypothetical protein HYQ46_011225 [Verticillium longisporum]
MINNPAFCNLQPTSHGPRLQFINRSSVLPCSSDRLASLVPFATGTLTVNRHIDGIAAAEHYRRPSGSDVDFRPKMIMSLLYHGRPARTTRPPNRRPAIHGCRQRTTWHLS